MMQLEPESTDAAGIPGEMPDDSHVEGAELLANGARPALRSRGFTDAEINEWALTYIAEVGTGDTDSFLSWMERAEHGR
jgi:hypothetical protein